MMKQLSDNIEIQVSLMNTSTEKYFMRDNPIGIDSKAKAFKKDLHGTNGYGYINFDDLFHVPHWNSLYPAATWKRKFFSPLSQSRHTPVSASGVDPSL